MLSCAEATEAEGLSGGTRKIDGFVAAQKAVDRLRTIGSRIGQILVTEKGQRRTQN